MTDDLLGLLVFGSLGLFLAWTLLTPEPDEHPRPDTEAAARYP